LRSIISNGVCLEYKGIEFFHTSSPVFPSRTTIPFGPVLITSILPSPVTSPAKEPIREVPKPVELDHFSVGKMISSVVNWYVLLVQFPLPDGSVALTYHTISVPYGNGVRRVVDLVPLISPF